MDIHKPKPWHGVREFLKEYLIIVIGVLTALGAEQAVEWLHWRHQAEVAREAIAFDLRRMVAQAAQKDTETPCVAARLAQFSAVLDGAQATKRFARMGWSGHPSTAGWTLRSWSGLTSGQVLAHIPNREQLLLVAMSDYLDILRDNRKTEQEEWSRLETLATAGRATSDAEIADLRRVVDAAYHDASSQRTFGRQLDVFIVNSGFVSHADIDRAFREGAAQGQKSKVCEPLAAPPMDVAHEHRALALMGPPRPPSAIFDFGRAGVGVGGALSTER